MAFIITPGIAYEIKGCYPGFMNKKGSLSGRIRQPVTILSAHVDNLYYAGIESTILWKSGSFIYFKDRVTGRVYAQDRSLCGQTG